MDIAIMAETAGAGDSDSGSDSDSDSTEMKNNISKLLDDASEESNIIRSMKKRIAVAAKGTDADFTAKVNGKGAGAGVDGSSEAQHIHHHSQERVVGLRRSGRRRTLSAKYSEHLEMQKLLRLRLSSDSSSGDLECNNNSNDNGNGNDSSSSSMSSSYRDSEEERERGKENRIPNANTIKPGGRKETVVKGKKEFKAKKPLNPKKVTGKRLRDQNNDKSTSISVPSNSYDDENDDIEHETTKKKLSTMSIASASASASESCSATNSSENIPSSNNISGGQQKQPEFPSFSLEEKAAMERQLAPQDHVDDDDHPGSGSGSVPRTPPVTHKRPKREDHNGGGNSSSSDGIHKATPLVEIMESVYSSTSTGTGLSRAPTMSSLSSDDASAYSLQAAAGACIGGTCGSNEIASANPGIGNEGKVKVVTLSSSRMIVSNDAASAKTERNTVSNEEDHYCGGEAKLSSSSSPPPSPSSSSSQSISTRSAVSSLCRGVSDKASIQYSSSSTASSSSSWSLSSNASVTSASGSTTSGSTGNDNDANCSTTANVAKRRGSKSCGNGVKKKKQQRKKKRKHNVTPRRSARLSAIMNKSKVRSEVDPPPGPTGEDVDKTVNEDTHKDAVVDTETDTEVNVQQEAGAVLPTISLNMSQHGVSGGHGRVVSAEINADTIATSALTKPIVRNSPIQTQLDSSVSREKLPEALNHPRCHSQQEYSYTKNREILTTNTMSPSNEQYLTTAEDNSEQQQIFLENQQNSGTPIEPNRASCGEKEQTSTNSGGTLKPKRRRRSSVGLHVGGMVTLKDIEAFKKDAAGKRRGRVSRRRSTGNSVCDKDIGIKEHLTTYASGTIACDLIESRQVDVARTEVAESSVKKQETGSCFRTEIQMNGAKDLLKATAADIKSEMKVLFHGLDVIQKPSVSARLFAYVTLHIRSKRHDEEVLQALVPFLQALVQTEMASLNQLSYEDNLRRKKVHFCSFDYSTTITPVDTIIGSNQIIEECIDRVHKVMVEFDALRERNDLLEVMELFKSTLCALEGEDGHATLNECSKTMPYPWPVRRFTKASQHYRQEFEYFNCIFAHEESQDSASLIRKSLGDFIGRAIRFHLRRLFNPVPCCLSSDSTNLPDYSTTRSRIHEIIEMRDLEDGEPRDTATADGSISSVIGIALQRIVEFRCLNDELIGRHAEHSGKKFSNLFCRRPASLRGLQERGCVIRLDEEDVADVILDIEESHTVLAGIRAARFIHTLFSWPGVSEAIQEVGGWNKIESLASMFTDLNLVNEMPQEHHFTLLRNIEEFFQEIQRDLEELERIEQTCEDCLRKIWKKFRCGTRNKELVEFNPCIKLFQELLKSGKETRFPSIAETTMWE